jgi:hypothetical protein
MASWKEVAESAPEFAVAARALFDVHKHKTLATLRKNGSPRISGTEIEFVEDDIWFGAMWESRKALDLQGDPRFALHGPTVDPGGDWRGDVKLNGKAVEEMDEARKERIVPAQGHPPGPFHLFRAEIEEVVLTRLGDPADHLVIELWAQGKGLRSFKR